MNIVSYSIGNSRFFDFYSIQNILRVNECKLKRSLKGLDNKHYLRYKNQFLYNQTTLFELMELQLIEKLDKIKRNNHGL
jgi:hypothetical protein